MSTRDIIHLPNAGISIGVDANDGKVRIAFAFCNSFEPFSRKGGNHILNLRFDGADVVLNIFNIRRNLFEVDYDGKCPRKDILFPIADYVRDELGFKIYSDRYYPPGTEYNEDTNTVIIPSGRVQRSVNNLRRQIHEFVGRLDTALALQKEEEEVLVG